MKGVALIVGLVIVAFLTTSCFASLDPHHETEETQHRVTMLELKLRDTQEQLTLAQEKLDAAQSELTKLQAELDELIEDVRSPR